MTRTVPRSPVTLPPVALTPEQAAAIAVALAAQPDGPYAADGPRRRSSRCSRRSSPIRGAARRLVASSLLVRVRGRPRRRRCGRRSSRALTRHRVLVLRYRDGKGAASRREVEPQLLARTADHEYLVAWCRERQAVRWFRLDRVESAELTDRARAPP